MSLLDKEYLKAKMERSDINEHVQTLCSLAMECSHVTEMGTRSGVSTMGFLQARPDTLVLIDQRHRVDTKHLIQDIAKEEGLHVEIIDANTCDIVIEETDLLFIDTLHTYNQLTKELHLHGNKARKYLAFHDTETFGRKGEDGQMIGLLSAIQEFRDDNPHWVIKKQYMNNNGLMVLRRACRNEIKRNRHNAVRIQHDAKLESL